jgi:hypothetical protein
LREPRVFSSLVILHFYSLIPARTDCPKPRAFWPTAFALCLPIPWITPGSRLSETAYALLPLVAGTTACRSIHTEKQEATMTSFHLVMEEMKLQRSDKEVAS